MTGAAASYKTGNSGKYRENTRFGVLPSTISLKIREPGSALTHFAGFLLTAIAAGPLLAKTKMYGSPMTLAGMTVFVLSACLLYAASTAYHTLVGSLRATTVLRKLDHSSISVMIAGTYTPVCLTVLRDRGGIRLLAGIWILAAFGMLLKLLWVTCPKPLSSAVYIAMGWFCVFSLGDIVDVLSTAGFAWLLAGGIAYSLGAIIYGMHPKEFDRRHIYFGSHEIFHVMIMAGTFCHFMLMYTEISCVR